jgi:PhzF family phenazine biosynthesis protein
MTTIKFYHVDAFTDQLFGGNPAAVCLLPSWLPDKDLQAIARENNLPVTAFLVYVQEQFFIRWITPEQELELCGHGALAAAYVIFNELHPSWNSVTLHSSTELLPVVCVDHLITLNFPAKNVTSCDLPLLAKGLGQMPREIYQHNQERCVAVFDSEDIVYQLQLDLAVLKKLPHRGIVVTAPGKSVDFVSRTFYPQKNIAEDPVTGASHCLLIPYWAKRLNKKALHAKQISERGGELFCHIQDGRVLIGGHAVLYMSGTLILDIKA